MPAAPRCLFRDLIFSHRPAAHLFPRREERDLFVDAVRGLGLPVCLKSDETAKLADPHACRGVRRRERGHDAERPTDVAVVNRARGHHPPKAAELARIDVGPWRVPSVCL